MLNYLPSGYPQHARLLHYGFMGLILVCASAMSQPLTSDKPPPISDKPPVMQNLGQTPESLTQTDNQLMISEAERVFGSRIKAADLAAQSGWHHMQKGDVLMTTQRFNQALILDPGCASAYWGLGMMTGQQGKFDVAIDMLNRAHKLEPNNFKMLTDMGIIHMRHGLSYPAQTRERQKAFETSLQWFAEAEKRDPSYKPIYTNRAVVYTYMGNAKEARSNLLRADALDRASVDTRMVDHLSRQFKAPQTQATPTQPTPQKLAPSVPNAIVPTASTPQTPAGTLSGSATAIPPAAQEKLVAEGKPSLPVQVLPDIAPTTNPTSMVDVPTPTKPSQADHVQPVTPETTLTPTAAHPSKPNDSASSPQNKLSGDASTVPNSTQEMPIAVDKPSLPAQVPADIAPTNTTSTVDVPAPADPSQTDHVPPVVPQATVPPTPTVEPTSPEDLLPKYDPLP